MTLKEIKETNCKTLQEIMFFDGVLAVIESNNLLKKEKQNKKQECIEFSKYIRNGKDHFNNGHSTEMVFYANF